MCMYPSSTCTWTYHLHKGYRLPTHTHITLPHPSRSWSNPPTHSTPHLHHPQDRNTITPPVRTGLVKPNPIPLNHQPPHLIHIPGPNTYTFHTLHQLFHPLITFIPSMSATLCTIAEPHVSPTHSCPALTQPHLSRNPTPALPSPSHPHTLSACPHPTQTTVHASQSVQPPYPHRVPRQPNNKTFYRTCITT